MTAGTPTRVTRGDQIPATPPSKAKIVGIPTMEVNTIQNTYYNIKPITIRLSWHVPFSVYLKFIFIKLVFYYHKCTILKSDSKSLLLE